MIASDFARELRDRKVALDTYKTSGEPYLSSTRNKNHLVAYFQECQRNGVVPLPLLFKVYKQRLSLSGYTLNEGVTTSLAQAFKVYP
jgi:hypothetical protein